jgi:hypothetical protein
MAIFRAFNVPRAPTLFVQQLLNVFSQHCVQVQSGAIHIGTSIYAAAERFIHEEGNESVVVTFYAVLREGYHRASSPAAQNPTMASITSAQDDLIFDYVITGAVAELSCLDDPLHYQYIEGQLPSRGTAQALWDLSRLPPGSHQADSLTFVSLQRHLIPLGTW